MSAAIKEGLITVHLQNLINMEMQSSRTTLVKKT